MYDVSLVSLRSLLSYQKPTICARMRAAAPSTNTPRRVPATCVHVEIAIVNRHKLKIKLKDKVTIIII